jgi:hypothetical protein
MKRIRMRRVYHDSQLLRAEWLHDDRDLLLTFRLDGTWNGDTSVEASVMFSAVRNREEVDDELRSLAEASVGRDYVADVVTIVRESNRRFLVDTSQGALVIDAAGLSEI